MCRLFFYLILISLLLSSSSYLSVCLSLSPSLALSFSLYVFLCLSIALSFSLCLSSLSPYLFLALSTVCLFSVYYEIFFLTLCVHQNQLINPCPFLTVCCFFLLFPYLSVLLIHCSSCIFLCVGRHERVSISMILSLLFLFAIRWGPLWGGWGS